MINWLKFICKWIYNMGNGAGHDKPTKRAYPSEMCELYLEPMGVELADIISPFVPGDASEIQHVHVHIVVTSRRQPKTDPWVNLS